MNRFALACRLFALTAVSLITTTTAFAYPHKLDLNLGRHLFGQQTPTVAPDYREYQALSPRAAYSARPTVTADYISDVSHEGIYTWQADKLPIKIFVSNGQGVPGYRPQFGQYIRSSFDTWCQASGNKLAWVEVTDPNKADITVWWTDKVYERPEGTEAGKTSALTRLNTATGKGIIYGARMQMLTRLPGRDFGDEEVAKTCLHEAGHALGLQGHSRARGDIMYYAVSSSQEFELSSRDRATITRLYAEFPVQAGLAVGPKPANN